MNPIIVSLIAAPNSQRTMIFDLVLKRLSENLNVMPYSCDLEKDEKLTLFESYYKAGLRFMINDLQNRAVAREKNVDILLYKFSALDVIGFCNANKTIGTEYKSLIQKNMLSHLERFPVSLVLYCEPKSYPQNDPNFMPKERRKLLIDSAIIKLLENYDFETIPLDSVENRVETAFDLIIKKWKNTDPK